MSAKVTFLDRIKAVITPTRAQALGSFFLSMLLITLAQSSTLIGRLGLPQSTITASQVELAARFEQALHSNIAAHIALVTFWAFVGLIAYLICWGIYNVLIEARNEVTLNTVYTNRGHWRGPFETLALKAFSAVGLALIINSLWYGVAFWLALAGKFLTYTTPLTAATAILAILGLAAQLYLVLVFIQLTFTPWYRAETFAEPQN